MQVYGRAQRGGAFPELPDGRLVQVLDGVCVVEIGEPIDQRAFEAELGYGPLELVGGRSRVLQWQGVSDRDEAIATAQRLNDQLADLVAQWPERFAAFAALPLQDPAAAADELERAMTQLGFKGALINGFSNLDDTDTVQYLDEPPIWEFWERAAALGAPVYLHPRDPLVSQRRIYKGYPALVGSPFGFGIETATHCLRLMLSGLFDRFPGLRIIVGHLGEGLPFLLPRVDHRLRHAHPESHGKPIGRASCRERV